MAPSAGRRANESENPAHRFFPGSGARGDCAGLSPPPAGQPRPPTHHATSHDSYLLLEVGLLGVGDNGQGLAGAVVVEEREEQRKSERVRAARASMGRKRAQRVGPEPAAPLFKGTRGVQPLDTPNSVRRRGVVVGGAPRARVCTRGRREGPAWRRRRSSQTPPPRHSCRILSPRCPSASPGTSKTHRTLGPARLVGTTKEEVARADAIACVVVLCVVGGDAVAEVREWEGSKKKQEGGPSHEKGRISTLLIR
jgi:hypothetical protein